MLERTLFASASLLALVGCGSSGLELEGEYTSTGVWDLSGPVGPDGIGGGFADLLLDETVTAAAPGIVEDEALDLARSLARASIVDAIDAELPVELKKDGAVMTDLRAALTQVEVETRIVFTDGVEGTEVIERLRFQLAGDELVIDGDTLPVGVRIAADFEGDYDEDDRIELDTYPIELRFGELILILIDDLLGRDAVALRGLVGNAIPCESIVSAATGGDGTFEIELIGQSVDISADALGDACDSAKDSLETYVLGFARIDSGVEMEGPISLVDEDGDGRADVLTSDAEFEGKFTLLPRPLEISVDPSFMASRQ